MILNEHSRRSIQLFRIPSPASLFVMLEKSSLILGLFFLADDRLAIDANSRTRTVDLNQS